MLSIDKESPFYSGKPVNPNYFTGRQKIINHILRYVGMVKNGNTQHYFITGKKGLGKTSLAKYVQNISSDYLEPIYISNKGNISLELLTKNIISSVLGLASKDSIKNKIKNVFGNYVESIEIKGTKINFKLNDLVQEDLINDFPFYLKEAYDELNLDKGIFLVIDDINSLSNSKKFSDWYKRLVDVIEVKNYKLPFYFLLAGYPETFDKLAIQDESFSRIFHYDTIGYLTDGEIKEFFKDTFDSVNTICDEDALEIMTTFSKGSPLMMQDIGEAVFWQTDDLIVDKNDAIEGIIEAGRTIGKKQIKPVLDKSIRSKNYESILLKLGIYGVDLFKKGEFEKNLSSEEKKAFPKFLKRAVELNILESIGKDKSGEYKFTNRLYLVYFMILAFENSNNIHFEEY